jgi:hypothetical protein
MKKITILLLFYYMTLPTQGAVSTRVCEADDHTLFDDRDIMVGTKLTVLVGSNLAEYWYGGALGVEEDDMLNIGCLYGRGYDGFGYPNSCLPAAGVDAAVWSTVSYGYGFEFYGGYEPNVGDCFIFDYNALGIGDCNIDFYDFDHGTKPIHTLTLHHVRTRDFDGDTVVGFADLSVLTSYWLATDCNEPDWCKGTDLNTSHNVDFRDFALFCKYWLEATMYSFNSNDFNRDTRVDFADFSTLASYWCVTDCLYSGWCQGTDLDTDDDVDFNDLRLFVDDWLVGTK